MISKGLRDLIRWLLVIPSLLLRFIRDWIHFRRLASRFPGPPSLPLVGNLFYIGFPFPEALYEFSSDFLRKPDNELFHATARAQELLAYRISHPWLIPDFIFYQLTSFGKEINQCKKIYFAFCETVLSDREKLFDELEKTKEDCAEPNDKMKRFGFIDTLIQNMKNGELTRDEVIEEIVTFMGAGFDTTYSSLLLSLYLISKHPHVQEKLYSEIRDTFNESGSTNLTPDMLQKTPYMEKVLKECLRLYPSVWIHFRMTGVDTPLATSDLVVPAGGVVAISPKSMHMNPKLFPDPEVFDPERFSPENSTGRHPYAFLAFSMGKRACIGRRFAWMQMKVIISKLIWNFDILPDPTYTPKVEWGVTSVPSNGMRVRLKKRGESQVLT